MLKIGMSAITGIVDGIKNDKGIYEVKRGSKSNGERYQIFNIKVSNREIDGTWTKGKPIKVILSGNDRVEVNEKIGIIGRFKPSNYVNKEGTLVIGNEFSGESLFTPDSWEKKEEPKATKPTQQASEESDWF